jgi:hypothetical protein
VPNQVKAGSSRATRRSVGERAGQSALEARDRERLARRRRLALAVPMGLCALAAGLVGAALHLGVIDPAGKGLTIMGLVIAGPAIVGWAPLGLLVVLGGAATALWPRGDPERWARGAAGEVATAELLKRLSSRRWFVAHDLRLPNSRANVDHLVIGPTGVWVVDTKAYRARVRVRWRRVLVGGVPLSTTSVRWEAQVVSDILGVETRPVIALHATGLPRRGRSSNGVLVLPAGRLARRLARGAFLRPTLTARQVQDLAQLAPSRFS